MPDQRLSLPLRLAAFVLPMLCMSAVSAEDLPGDPLAGKALVEDRCTECHEVAPGYHGPGVLGAPAFQDVADDAAVTALALRAFLQTPHSEMPNVILSPAETDDVISYILDLRR